MAAAVVWWFMARDLENSGEEAGGSHHSFIASMKVFPMLLGIPIMKITLVVSLGGFFFRHGLNDWLPEILRDGGMTAAAAGFWSVLPIVVGIGTTMVVPPMATPRRRIPMLLVFFLASGAAALVVGNSTGVQLTLGLVIMGAASRAVSPIIMLILMDAPQVGQQRMGAAGGLYFMVGEVGGVLGPLFLGVIADVSGGFLASLLMLAAMSVALAALSVRLGFLLRRVA